MSGYLDFRRTAVAPLDGILTALERAGALFHHTSEWREPWPNKDDPSPADAIQQAADAAAASVRDLEAERDTFKHVAAFTKRAWDDFANELRQITKYTGPDDGDQLLAHVRDLEAARVRAEGERDAARSWGIAMMSEAHATYHQTAKDWLACPRPTCVAARAALAPPERSRVAPAAPDTEGGEV